MSRINRDTASRRQKQIAKLGRERRTVMDQMTPKLRKKCAQIVRMADDARTANMTYYYKLGTICLDVEDHPEQYGANALEQLEKVVSLDSQMLRKAVRLVRAVPEVDFNQLVELHNPTTDYRLHMGHVTHLLAIENRRERLRWAKQAVSEQLDPDTLEEMVRRDVHGGARRSQGGRRHQLPSSTIAQLRQVLSHTTIWVDKSRQVWAHARSNVFNNVIQSPPEQYREHIQPMLLELQTALSAMQEQLQTMQTELTRTVAHVESSVVQQDAQDAHPAAGESSNGRRRVASRGARSLRRVGNPRSMADAAMASAK